MKAAHPPQLSVVVPAWNEESYLPVTLAALDAALAESGVIAEVIVVDNDSSDQTATVARRAGARVVHEPERRIAAARNAGARAARADRLLFLDADTRVVAAHIEQVVRAFAEGWAGGGALVSLDRPVAGVAGYGLQLWNKASWHLRLAAGCFLFVRRDLHRAVGGFDKGVYAGEELGYSRRLARLARRSGMRFGILDAPPVISSGRKLSWFSPWQHMLVLLTFVLFPWAGRVRALTWFWYRRPRDPGGR